MAISAHTTVFLRVQIASDSPSYPRTIANFCSRPVDYLAHAIFNKKALLHFYVPIEAHTHNKTFWPKIDPQWSESTAPLIRIFKVTAALLLSPLYLVTLAIKVGLLCFSSLYREQYFVMVNYWEGKYISETDFSNRIDKNREINSTLEAFPTDPLGIISAHLDALDITRLSSACKYLRMTMASNTIWEHQPFFYGIHSKTNNHPKQLVKLKFYSVIDWCSDIFVNLMSVNRILYMDVLINGKFYDKRGKLRANALTELPDYQVVRNAQFLEFEFSWANHSPEQSTLYETIHALFSRAFKEKKELSYQAKNHFPRYYRLLVTSKYKEGSITFLIGSNQNNFETHWSCKFDAFRSQYDGFKQDFRNWREKFFRLALE